MILVLLLSSLTYERDGKSIVLAGIAVHSLAQTALVCLKLTADPEKQLSSIEYWIMGSLNGINIYSIGSNVILCAVCLLIMFLLYRQIIMLSLDDAEGKMLGVNVNQIRMLVLFDRNPGNLKCDQHDRTYQLYLSACSARSQNAAQK